MTTAPTLAAPQPFIKWVGGKRQLLPELLKRVPPKFSRYFEPFMGGAALFWALRPERATLGDLNPRLVKTYQAVRGSVDEVILRLRGHARLHAKNAEHHYYAIRDMQIDSYPEPAIAAWFIYLNKTCFNGLYRENRSGKFNTPIGSFKTPPTICDEENLRACSEALAGHAAIVHQNFATTVAEAETGDFVYFDPPYVPASGTADFTAYTKAGFGPEQQRNLRDVARVLKMRGVHVLLSNNSVPEVHDLYGGPEFTIEEVDARRNVNSKGTGRGAVKEVLIR